MPPTFIDGYLGTERLVSTAPEIDYPFANAPTPDVQARLIRRRYEITPSRFSPQNALRLSLTNLLTYSEDFDNPAWSKYQSTINANAAANPDTGTLTGDAIVETTAADEHRISQALTVAATAHTLSVFCYPLVRDYVCVRFIDSAATSFFAYFNVSTGLVVSTGGGATATITPAGGGWYWCKLTFTPASGTGTVYFNTSDTGARLSYAGSTSAGVYVYGAQLAATSSPVAYVATSSASRTGSLPPTDYSQHAASDLLADPFAYLVQESPLRLLNSARGAFERVFARIPATQTAYRPQIINKPAIPGDATFPKVLGDYLVTQPDTNLEKYNAFLRRTVASDTGAPSFYPTGGTYTLTFAGNTTGALNYNDSAATVQTALNALTSVTNRGGCTVTGSYNSSGGLAITFASYAQITISAGSLTGSGSRATLQSLVNGGYTQTVGAYYVPPYYIPTADTSALSYSSSLITAFIRRDYPSARTTFIQIIAGGAITGGTYTLTLNGATTAAIAYNADATAIAAAVNALGVGTYAVSGGFISTVSWIEFYLTTLDEAPTGGTYTLTVGADTTGSLNYNDSAATVQTALNALTSVTNRGGCTVTGSLATGWVINFANAVLTANAASLTPSPSSATPEITDGLIGRTQRVVFLSSSAVRTLYIEAHGFSVTDTLFLKSGSTYYSVRANSFTLPDANTVRLNASPADTWAAAGTITEAGRMTKQGYQPGAVRASVAEITNYYLPGVTRGIATVADIPFPTNTANATDFLLSLLSGSASVVVNVGELTPWQGPIYALTYQQVDSSLI